MRRIFGFLIGLLVGGLAGAAFALLFAPESGEKMRAELRSRSTGFVGEIKTATESRRKQLEDQLAALRLPSKSA